MDTSPVPARPDLRDFHVDGWFVQPGLNLLVRGETSIRVRPQLIDVLSFLAVRPGAVVTKNQLLSSVWSDRHVCESGIARCVAELRHILADDARRPRIIQTIPKRGYRLIAPVEHADGPNTAPTDAAVATTSGEPEGDRLPTRAPWSDCDPGIGIRAGSVRSRAAGLFAVCRQYLARAAQ